MIRYAAAALLGAGLLCSCTETAGNTATVDTTQDPPGSMRRIDYHAGKGGSPKERLLVGDSGLLADLDVAEVLVKVLPSGLSQAQLTLVSRTRSNVEFEYQFEWFDKDGMRIDTAATGWMGEKAGGLDARHIQGVGPSPEAKVFKIKVRKALGSKS